MLVAVLIWVCLTPKFMIFPLFSIFHTTINLQWLHNQPPKCGHVHTDTYMLAYSFLNLTWTLRTQILLQCTHLPAWARFIKSRSRVMGWEWASFQENTESRPLSLVKVTSPGLGGGWAGIWSQACWSLGRVPSTTPQGWWSRIHFWALGIQSWKGTFLVQKGSHKLADVLRQSTGNWNTWQTVGSGPGEQSSTDVKRMNHVQLGTLGNEAMGRRGRKWTLWCICRKAHHTSHFTPTALWDRQSTFYRQGGQTGGDLPKVTVNGGVMRMNGFVCLQSPYSLH